MTLAQRMLGRRRIDLRFPTGPGMKRAESAMKRAGWAVQNAGQTMQTARATVAPLVRRAPWWIWLGAGVILLLPLLARRGRRRARTVGQTMVHHVLTVDTGATLKEAAQRMREGNVGALPVVEGGRLRGLVTDRDLVVRAMAVGADPSTTRVGDCMTTGLVCARPDWDVEDAMDVMAERQIGRLPVVDDDDRPVGMVTLASLALRSHDEAEALQTAKRVSRRSARVA